MADLPRRSTGFTRWMATSSKGDSTRYSSRATGTCWNFRATSPSTRSGPASAPTPASGNGAATPPSLVWSGHALSCPRVGSLDTSGALDRPRGLGSKRSSPTLRPERRRDISGHGRGLTPGVALADVVGAGEVVGQKADEEGGWEAYDVEVVAF